MCQKKWVSFNLIIFQYNGPINPEAISKPIFKTFLHDAIFSFLTKITELKQLHTEFSVKEEKWITQNIFELFTKKKDQT